MTTLGAEIHLQGQVEAAKRLQQRCVTLAITVTDASAADCTHDPKIELRLHAIPVLSSRNAERIWRPIPRECYFAPASEQNLWITRNHLKEPLDLALTVYTDISFCRRECRRHRVFGWCDAYIEFSALVYSDNVLTAALTEKYAIPGPLFPHLYIERFVPVSPSRLSKEERSVGSISPCKNALELARRRTLEAALDSTSSEADSSNSDSDSDDELVFRRPVLALHDPVKSGSAPKSPRSQKFNVRVPMKPVVSVK
jgi:hypothetical protein